MGGAPTYASIVQRGFKQGWIQPSNDESFWTYPGRFQWWYKKNPTHIWLPDLNPRAKKEWLTKIPLEKPYAHRKYNRGKKCLYFGFVLHNVDDILKGEDLSGLTDEEKKEMGRWENLSPKHGGMIVWGMGYSFYNPSSDWFNVDELMPDRKDVEKYLGKTVEERQKETPTRQIILNHVPIIMDGKAYPVYRMTDCVNGYNLRNQMKKRNLGMIQVGSHGEQTLACPDCGFILPTPDEDQISVCGKCHKRWDLKRA